MITLHIPLIGYAKREPPKFNRQEWGLWITYEQTAILASLRVKNPTSTDQYVNL
jgi:hypothetical protein